LRENGIENSNIFAKIVRRNFREVLVQEKDEIYYGKNVR